MSASSGKPQKTDGGGSDPGSEHVNSATEQVQAVLSGSDGEDWVEGGEITLGPVPVSWKEKHETETAKVLAFSLLGILAASLLLHYIAVIILMIYDQKDAVDVLSKVFDSWLPVISGFVGGAVTFYLTRQKG